MREFDLLLRGQTIFTDNKIVAKPADHVIKPSS
jgi:hypothetical protein